MEQTHLSYCKVAANRVNVRVVCKEFIKADAGSSSNADANFVRLDYVDVGAILSCKAETNELR